MNAILLTLGFLVGGVDAAPAWSRVQTMEMAVDVSTVSTIDVASNTATAVASSSVFGSTVNVWGIEVYNLAGNAYAFNCGFTANVSTITSNVAYGREVQPGQGILWQADFNKNVLRCKTQDQGSTSLPRMTVTLFR